MVALIALGHGSRHPSAHRGVDTLTAAAGMLLGVEAHTAYLDLSEPLLIDAAQDLAAAGHERAVIVPLLFTDAYHAKVDVPAAVREAEQASGMNLILAPGLGVGSDIAQLLAHRVDLDAPPQSEIALYSVGTSNKTANHTVQQLADAVAALTGRRVHVTAATCGKGVADVAPGCAALHVLPLFVSEGLLLDKVMHSLDQLAHETNTLLTASDPLTVGLADIVAQRYRDSVYIPA